MHSACRWNSDVSHGEACSPGRVLVPPGPGAGQTVGRSSRPAQPPWSSSRRRPAQSGRQHWYPFAPLRRLVVHDVDRAGRPVESGDGGPCGRRTAAGARPTPGRPLAARLMPRRAAPDRGRASAAPCVEHSTGKGQNGHLERSRGDPRSARVSAARSNANPDPGVAGGNRRGRLPSLSEAGGKPSARLPAARAVAGGRERGWSCQGIDRGTDAPDAPRPESPTTVTGRGAVLADAPARRECALAYRVTVDAELARAAPTRAPAATATPTAAEQLRRMRPCSRHHLARHPGRSRGAREPAGRRGAARRDERMGGPLPRTGVDGRDRAAPARARSSAVVGFDRADAPGHWFNAVNYQGSVLAVDGQGARFQDWPPSRDGLGFDESEMSHSDSIYFTPDGKAARQ
jgi:hypothetical protein